MEALARELALSIGSGPTSTALGDELRKLLPGLSSLVMQVDLFAIDCTVMATTPNIIHLDVPSARPMWQLKLAQQADSGREWEPLIAANSMHTNRNPHATSSGKYQRYGHFNQHVCSFGVIVLSHPFMRCRTLPNGQLQLKYGINSHDHAPDGTPVQIGALVATCNGEINASTKTQNTLEQLATALSHEHKAILEFSTSVGSVLFGPPHSPAESSDFQVDIDDLNNSDSEAHDEHPDDDSDEETSHQREIMTSPARHGAFLGFF